MMVAFKYVIEALPRKLLCGIKIYPFYPLRSPQFIKAVINLRQNEKLGKIRRTITMLSTPQS